MGSILSHFGIVNTPNEASSSRKHNKLRATAHKHFSFALCTGLACHWCLGTIQIQSHLHQLGTPDWRFSSTSTVTSAVQKQGGKWGCSWSHCGTETLQCHQFVVHWATMTPAKLWWLLQPQAICQSSGMDQAPAVVCQMFIACECQMHLPQWHVNSSQTHAVSHCSGPTQRS